MSDWTAADSATLYGVERWGAPYFSIDNETGTVLVHPDGKQASGVDLMSLVEGMKRRDIGMPVLLRFNGILKHRLDLLCEAFTSVMDDLGYAGNFRGVYPIKVNQQRHIVEEIVKFGRAHHFGLEAGSKPELIAVLATCEDPQAPIICNGFKDRAYLEMILLATKMGREVIPVIEKKSELALILSLSESMGVKPLIGLRLKLSTRGAGRWIASGGANSKFGLTVGEVLSVVNELKVNGMLDCLKLIHFHLGSQITDISTVRGGVEEAARIYVQLHKLGAEVRYLDAGGGLAVDYDGSQTISDSSRNYDLKEYAYAMVDRIIEVCDASDVPHPDLITESGRAVTSHHSVLIFDVLGSSGYSMVKTPEPRDDDPDVVRNLYQVLSEVSRTDAQSALHDGTYYLNDALSRFRLGLLDLEARARAEDLYWSICRACFDAVKDMEHVPPELATLERQLADTYFCNLSVFQSMPDSWAIDQLFPVMPIHRLHEEPERRAVLADLTCDSDGRIDRFIGHGQPKRVIELHSPGERPYYLAAFLVGAYQEILGDLHNLFGDTNAVHLDVDADGTYHIQHVLRGETVAEVLDYVEFDGQELTHKMMKMTEAAVGRGALSVEDAALFMRRYIDNLAGYTYME